MSDVNKNTELKIAFIADDIKKNLSEFDLFYNATFALMLAAQNLHTKILLAGSNGLKIINNKVFAKFDEVILKHKYGEHLAIKNSSCLPLNDFNIIFARKDPPVNQNFLSYIQTLVLVHNESKKQGKLKTLIINNPEGILKANEKLYPLNFQNIIPPTLVTYKQNEIEKFINEHNEVVIKPLFNKGGDGVYYLKKGASNCLSIIENSTKKETSPSLVQKYLPEVKGGDKRIVLLNGEPLGAIHRIPKEGEFRTSVRLGASVKLCKLSKRDLEICEALKPCLVRDGIYFASIDVIGDCLIEVNVTCPASLQEVERCTGRPAAKEIVSWAIKTVTE